MSFRKHGKSPTLAPRQICTDNHTERDTTQSQLVSFTSYSGKVSWNFFRRPETTMTFLEKKESAEKVSNKLSKWSNCSILFCERILEVLDPVHMQTHAPLKHEENVLAAVSAMLPSLQTSCLAFVGGWWNHLSSWDRWLSNLSSLGRNKCIIHCNNGCIIP